MKYCSKHDLFYSDGGTCWCCDQQKQSASWQDQEQQASSSLDAAQKALDQAKKDAADTEARIQKKLDDDVTAITTQLQQAKQAAIDHRAKMV